MPLQKLKHYGSAGSLGSRSSLPNLVKDGVDNLDDSVTKKWLSWMLRRHVQNSCGKMRTADANSIVDNTVQLTRELAEQEGTEIMNVPNDQTLFEERFLFFRVSAAVTFHTTHLSGLTTLQRRGDASLELDGDWLTLQAALVTDDVQCCSTCSAKFMDIGPSFELMANVDTVTVKIKLRINVATAQVIFCTCELVHVGDMTVTESGEVVRVVSSAPQHDSEALPLSSLLAVVTELFISRCNDNIIHMFEHEARRQLEAALLQSDLENIVRSYGRNYFKNNGSTVAESD